MVTRIRRQLESGLQKKVIGWARKELGLRCDKLSSGSVFQSSGIPDYILWIPAPSGTKKNGRPLASPLLIEFKTEDGELTPLQAASVGELTACGYEVHVVRTFEDGKRVILDAITKRNT